MKELFRPEVTDNLTRQEKNINLKIYEPSLFQVIIFILIFIVSLRFML